VRKQPKRERAAGTTYRTKNEHPEVQVGEEKKATNAGENHLGQTRQRVEIQGKAKPKKERPPPQTGMRGRERHKRKEREKKKKKYGTNWRKKERKLHGTGLWEAEKAWANPPVNKRKGFVAQRCGWLEKNLKTVGLGVRGRAG